MDDIIRVTCICAVSERSFDRVYTLLDTLHDFASEGRLVEVTDLTEAQIIGWLDEIIFIATEVEREIQTRPRAHRAIKRHRRPLTARKISHRGGTHYETR